MDPRHPELVLPRIKELIKQYDTLLKEISEEAVSNRLAELERKGSLFVTELCLVAPRLHDNLMNASRQRRSDLAKGILIEPQDTAVELPMEKSVEKSEPTEEKVAVSKKETTTKKKTTKKAKK